MAFLGGVLLAGWASRPAPGWDVVAAGLAALCCVAGAGWSWRGHRARWRLALLAGSALGLAGWGWTALHARLALDGQLPAALEDREVELRGVVASLPVAEARRSRFQLRVASASDLPPSLRGRLLQLAWYDDFGATAPGPRLALRAGETWQFRVRLRAPRGLRNPGGFDAERNAVAQRIAASGHVRQPLQARRLAAGQGLLAWRERMAARIDAEVPGPGGRYVRALALGDTRGLEEADWRLLRAVGLTHLIAISGFHVGLVALAGAWLVQGAWRSSACLPRLLPRRHAAALAALAAASAYAFVAGSALPTVRTVLMIAVVCLARLARRPVAVLQSLALALLAVLLVDPLSVLLPGFWLSFGGVACLALAMPDGPSRWWLDFPRAQGVVTVGLLPLSAAWFAQVSWVGPWINLLAIPWWSLVVVPLCLLGLVLEALHPGGGRWPWRLAAACFDPSWRLFAAVGARAGSHAWLVETGLAASVLALLGATWWLLPRGTPGKALALLLWLPLFWPDLRRPKAGEVALTVFDVGQGLSVLVRTRGHALLYDAGPQVADGFDAGERVVVPGLRALGVHELDELVVSHADSDHAGGVEAVRAALPIARMRAPPGAPLPAGAGACVAGQGWRWDGVEFRFLHPPAGFPYLRNESSCVLRVQSAAGTLLLTGDIGRVIEQRLLKDAPRDLRATVVVAPHHGSASSSSPGFVAATGAELVVFSAGHGNRFGHPRSGVVAWWRRAGARDLVTAQGGAIRVWLRGNGTQFRETRRWPARWWDAAERRRATAILSTSIQTAERAGGLKRVGTGQGRRLADDSAAPAGGGGAGDRAGAAVVPAAQ